MTGRGAAENGQAAPPQAARHEPRAANRRRQKSAILPAGAHAPAKKTAP